MISGASLTGATCPCGGSLPRSLQRHAEAIQHAGGAGYSDSRVVAGYIQRAICRRYGDAHGAHRILTGVSVGPAPLAILGNTRAATAKDDNMWVAHAGAVAAG